MSQNLKDYKDEGKIRARQSVFHSVVPESHVESLQTYSPSYNCFETRVSVKDSAVPCPS